MNSESLKRPANDGEVVEEEAGDGGLTHIHSGIPSGILLGPVQEQAQHLHHLSH